MGSFGGGARKRAERINLNDAKPLFPGPIPMACDGSGRLEVPAVGPFQVKDGVNPVQNAQIFPG